MILNGIHSSTLAIPVVKAGGFFAIPFIKGKNDKESVPLFVVTDSVNSFAMQVSISSTFYLQIVHSNVVLAAFSIYL